MTVLYASINSNVISDKFFSLRISGEDGYAVRHFEAILFNIDNVYDGSFPHYSRAFFIIDRNRVLDGYVDDSEPYVNPKFVDVSFIKVIGRCKGFDLQARAHTELYDEEKLDDIFDDALLDTGVEIVYTSPASGPEENYEFKDTYLERGFKELAERNNYAYYVDHSTPPLLHLFPIGDSSEYLDGTTVSTISQGGAYTSLSITGITDFATLQANGGTPFSGLKEGDQITLSNCEDSENDGVYYIGEKTSDLIIVLDGPAGAVNAADTSVVITHKRPDVDLVLDDDDLTNNMLRLNKGVYGRNVKNYVKLNAGPILDHWTDVNAADFTEAANTTVTDAQPTFNSKPDYFGNGLIKIARTTGSGNGIARASLDFSGELYNYSVLDLSQRNVLTYMAYPDMTQIGQATRQIRMFLIDGDGNEISYRRHVNFVNSNTRENRTDLLTNQAWTRVSLPYGKGLPIAAAAGTNETWGYVVQNTTFDWTDVVEIGWTSVSSISPDEYFYIDALEIPTVDCIAIDSDAALIAATTRIEHHDNRFDIRNQVTLDALATAVLDLKKKELTKITGYTKGTPDIKYVGQSLDVYSPPYNINTGASPWKFRVLSFEHFIAQKGSTPVSAYRYTTKVELIQDEVSGVQQLIDPKVADYTRNMSLSFWGSIEELREIRRQEEIMRYRNREWSVIPNEMPTGDTFPLDPLDGDYYHHTGHGETFVWDDSNSQWVAIDYIYNAVSGVTADREQSGITADREQAGMTADREQAGMTADREQAGMTADRETAGMTADRETSGVISDDADDRSILDRNVTEQININIGSSWTTIADWNTPTDDSEEMFIYITGRPRDATPNDLFIRVLAGAMYYPSSIGIKVFATNQYNSIGINFLAPRNTNNIRVRVQVKHLSVTERWDLRSEYQLHDIHSHDITEPNAGQGHDTAMNEPQSGTGHDTGLNEPNSGQGHDTGLNEPNSGQGHDTDLNEPNSGTGHDTDLNEPNGGQGHDTDLNEPNAGQGHGEGEAADGHNTYETADP